MILWNGLAVKWPFRQRVVNFTISRFSFSYCSRNLKNFFSALELNHLQPGTWFARGCASLICSRYSEAARCFRRCVTLEYDNYEAWANLANSELRAGNKLAAHRSLNEAIKVWLKIFWPFERPPYRTLIRDILKRFLHKKEKCQVKPLPNLISKISRET